MGIIYKYRKGHLKGNKILREQYRKIYREQWKKRRDPVEIEKKRLAKIKAWRKINPAQTDGKTDDEVWTIIEESLSPVPA
ncbi:MAG: hypothetical protein HC875_19150 [Anaerolineales bacterium]|nr:hypothetical protein [Anaerolineales bacterium]